jgi:ketosteroid isomerase-like protein
MTDPNLAQIAYDRSEITDVLYRYAAAIDNGDLELLASALVEDVVIDPSRLGARIGIEQSPMRGRGVVAKSLMQMLGPLDTSHIVSNVRVAVDGDTAIAQAYVMAQHFRPGEGARPRPERPHILYVNKYEAALVRRAKTWLISHITIDNAWADGDATAVFAAPSNE